MTKINLKEAKTEYVTGDCSLRYLACKHEVSYAAIQRRCQEEEWVRLRQEYRDCTATKAISKKSERESDALAKMQGVASRLAEDAEKILEQEYLHMYAEMERSVDGSENLKDVLLQTPNIKAYKDVVTAVKQLTSVIRDVYGIPTLQEQEQLKLARDKLELDRAKASMTDSEDGETGVVMLAPVLEEESDE